MINTQDGIPDSFAQVLIEQIENDDEQEKLIVYDFLLQDYAFSQFGLTSTELKSAVSAYGMQDEGVV